MAHHLHKEHSDRVVFSGLRSEVACILVRSKTVSGRFATKSFRYRSFRYNLRSFRYNLKSFRYTHEVMRLRL